MKTIQEYNLTLKSILLLPSTAKPLCLRWDKFDNLIMQVLMDPAAKRVLRCFIVHTVGARITERVCHVGTIVNADEQVLHIFEVLE